MIKDIQTGEFFRADHLIEGKKTKLYFYLTDYIYQKGHLEKLCEAKDISNETKVEIKRILPQVDFIYMKKYKICYI